MKYTLAYVCGDPLGSSDLECQPVDSIEEAAQLLVSLDIYPSKARIISGAPISEAYADDDPLADAYLKLYHAKKEQEDRREYLRLKAIYEPEGVMS